MLQNTPNLFLNTLAQFLLSNTIFNHLQIILILLRLFIQFLDNQTNRRNQISKKSHCHKQ